MIKLIKALLGLVVGGLLIVAGIAGGGGWSLMALTETYNGRLWLCAIMGVAGVIVTALLTALVWVANGLTEVRRPLGRWVLVFVAVFIAPAFLALIIATGVEATHWAMDHVALAAVSAAAVLLMVAAGLAIKARRDVPKPATTPEPIMPAPLAVPQPGHFLPDNADQWPR